MKDKGKRQKKITTPPVLFLDVDGVLNDDRTFLRKSGSRMDGDKVKRLNRVLSATGANVVLSTAWRAWGVDYVRDYLVRSGFKFPDRIIDRTAEFLVTPRGWEIYAWLVEHPEVTRFAIVDDWDEMVWLKGQHVLTDPAVGMTDADAARLIRLLTVEQSVYDAPGWAEGAVKRAAILAEEEDKLYAGWIGRIA